MGLVHTIYQLSLDSLILTEALLQALESFFECLDFFYFFRNYPIYTVYLFRQVYLFLLIYPELFLNLVECLQIFFEISALSLETIGFFRCISHSIVQAIYLFLTFLLLVFLI